MVIYNRRFSNHNTLFIDDIERPDLVFALCGRKYRPGCVVGDVDPTTKKVPVFFFHKNDEEDVHADDIIYHHSNMMMVKVSFCKRNKVYTGVVYGNDSPKYDDGEPRTFFIRISKKEIVSVPLKNVFLSTLQAQRLLHVTKPRKK